MRLFKIVAVAFGIALLCGTQDAEAKNKMVPKVYAFGISTSFNDSTVYITGIQDLDSAWVDSKTGFLLNREDYSYQMNNYFDALGQKHRTCVIISELKKKDLVSKFERIKKKYMGKENYNVKYLADKDFHFTVIQPDTEYVEEEVAPQPKHSKHKDNGPRPDKKGPQPAPNGPKPNE